VVLYWDKWRVVVKKVMSLWVQQISRHVLTNSENIRVSRKTLSLGISYLINMQDKCNKCR